MKYKIFENIISKYLKNHQKMIKSFDYVSLNKIIKILFSYINTNNTVYVCGNGGSAHTASHYVTDWAKMLKLKKNKNLKIISLNTEIGSITAFANDLSYEDIYSGQLKSLANKKDLLITISGSGNSRNIISALNYGKNIGMKTISITGFDGGEAKKISNFNFNVNSNDMQIIEDWHLIIGHIIMKNLIN